MQRELVTANVDVKSMNFLSCNSQCTLQQASDGYNWGVGIRPGPPPLWSQKRSQYLVTKNVTGHFGQPSAHT